MLMVKVIILFISLVLVASALAFPFNGTVTDVNGIALNNTYINVTVRDSNFNIVGYNSTTTNASGWFNMTVTEVTGGLYQPNIIHYNGSVVDFVGQTLPSFPSQIFSFQLDQTKFYLKPAGTIIITVINSTSGNVSFRYQIKDVKLGYPVAEAFTNPVANATVYLPRDRNYSIMVYPAASMPVSFNWNNFTATQSYSINSISSYNVTTRTLQKQFNTTLRLDRVSGYINYSGINGWTTFRVIPYLMEPGNMIDVNRGTLPNNLSEFTGGKDNHTLSNGFYNISLPATTETSNMMLFATATNGTSFYGAFKNVSLSYNNPAAELQINISMFGLLGASGNITQDTTTGGLINFTTALQQFDLLNSTNVSLTNVFAHVQAEVDYSNFGSIDFTWMTNIQQGAAAVFSLPLINATGVKKIDLFVSGGGSNYAPKSIAKTAAEIATNSSIALSSFNPQAIDSQLTASAISMALYLSNATCDLPNPSSDCLLGGSQTMDSFKPMSAILGGGKLSFRMGTGNIKIHYVNVDLLASGPPDVLFDSSTTSSASASTFDAAVRFGSGGPTIYDYVLVSLPYTETPGSGLNDASVVNISIPTLYDENWKVIWNVTTNGTNATNLAANNSHYSAFAEQWGMLLKSSACTTDQTLINTTTPCYIDTSSNVIWVRLPHFSGTGPAVTGTAVASTSTPNTGGGSSESSSSSSTSSAGSLPPEVSLEKEITITLPEPTITEGKIPFQEVLAYLKEGTKAKFMIKTSTKTTAEEHTITVTRVGPSFANFVISSTSQEVVLNKGASAELNLDGDTIPDLKLTLIDLNYALHFVNVSMELLTMGRAEMPQKPKEPEAVPQLPEKAKVVEITESSPVEEQRIFSPVYWVSGALILIVLLALFLKRKKSPHEIKKKK
ncbi:hypothetical protein HYX14_02815 [Candidatus Woesearchaeota archaeon]|nr:hypothetical protein [Candidatus Woesearchaeota archaeon]